MPSFSLGIFCWWRYRARTATTTTAACGRNREELLGQRSDFSRPRQGAEEKSANATRKAVRSTVSNQPSGLLLSPRWPTYRDVYQERCRWLLNRQNSRNEQKAGYHRGGGALPFALHPPIFCVSGRLLRTSVHSPYARTQEKGKVLAYSRGLLPSCMVYSSQ